MKMSKHMSERQSENKAANYWKAMESYNKAKGILLEKLKIEGTARIHLQLGHLQILMDDYSEAEKNLLSALSKDSTLIKAHDALSLIYVKREDYKNAISHLESAVKFDPSDLDLRSRLALAYLKARIVDKAEDNFKKILKITPFHVDSQIGLGEVYAYMGDLGEGEMYERAAEHFTLAISYTMSENGSRRLNKTELASVFYLRGFSNIRYFETVGASFQTQTKEKIFQAASVDFRNCLENDPEHNRAKIALKKLKTDRLNIHLIKRSISIFVAILSGLIFLTAQAGYFFSFPQPLKIEYYSLLTFGSTAFAILSIYLPWIFRLNPEDMELKRSSFVREGRIGLYSERSF
ncbi:MAG: tetratricopeptide repeat protein [Nitrospirae bacterium]|nr:tetratricopeptide repeat protein [Nitrospirota bacterium]